MRLPDLLATLRSAAGIVDKRDIQVAGRTLPWSVSGPWGDARVRLGDDCAAIPDGDGYLLLAAEGMWPELVASEPWFAGFCSVLVNASDVYAMGGRPLAVVDALWSAAPAHADRMLEGMRAASDQLGVPVVGGHTNLHSPHPALAVAILGRARALLTSFDARPGDDLVVAFDLRGRMHPVHPFWNATRGAPPARLRADYEVLPWIAERGLCRAAKDVSMGGVLGSVLMLLEASGVGAAIDPERIPRPPEVDDARWLLAFPSYGFVLAVPPAQRDQVLAAFAARDLAAAAIGTVEAGHTLSLSSNGERATLWDLSREGLTRLAAGEVRDA